MRDKEYDLSNPPKDANIIERLLWLIEYCKANNVRGIRYNKDIIEKAQVGNSYISDMKNGRVKHPTAEAIGSIADACGARVNWIIFGEGKPLLESDISKDDYKTEQAKELHNRIVRYLFEQKTEQEASSPPRNLLLAFQDQLKSQVAHSRNQLEQLESMLHFLGILLSDVDEVRNDRK